MSPYARLVAALDAQAAAKKAYYAESKVAHWRPLYDDLRMANNEVVKAARDLVKSGGPDGGIEVDGEDDPRMLDWLKAS